MTGLAFILLAAAAGLSAVLTFAVRAAGRRRTLFDSAGSDGHRKDLRAVPNIGGVAIVGTILACMASGLIAVWFAPGDLVDRLAPGAGEHLAGARQQTPMAIGLMLCVLALHVLGLVDDRRALPALGKLGAMIGVALVMPVVFDVRLLHALDAHAGGAWLSVLLTVLWLVAITNAMNFMDNMDGLCAGSGVVAGLLFLVAALTGGQWFVGATLAILVGALLGFLVFNAPRRGGATIFMGDGGSLVVGYLLAFLTVRTTFVGESAWDAGAWYAVCMPLCVLAVPLYDLTSVSLLRLSQGKSPLVGDQQHFSHRLVERGLTKTGAVGVICACCAVTGVGGILLTGAQPWQAALIGAQTLLVLAILAALEFAPRRDGVRA